MLILGYVCWFGLVTDSLHIKDNCNVFVLQTAPDRGFQRQLM